MAAQFRVGLLGAGYVSEFHVAALRRVANAEIVGVADLDPVRAKGLATRFKLPAFYGSLDELITAGANVVHILTPPAAHTEGAIRALEGGCHVLVEKPLATSVIDCERIEAAAAASGKSACVNHSNLRDPFVAKAIAIAKSGAIGDVIGVDYFRSSNYPPYRGGRLPPQYREGGYPFRDMGVHGLYIIQEVLGPIEDANAQFWTKGGDPNLLYDEWSAHVRCKIGLGRMRLSWNVQPLSNQLVIEGTRGIVRADMFAMYVTARRKHRLPTSASRIVNSIRETFDIGFQVPVNVARVVAGRLRRFHGLQDFVSDFYRSLTDNSRMPVNIGDAISVVKWTESIAEKADFAKTRMQLKYDKPLRAQVLVTGANGFIGRHLVSRLLEKRISVRLLVRSEPPTYIIENPLVEVVLGDLGDPDAVDRAVTGVDVIYHVGAAMRGAAHEFERGTIVGTANIVASARQHKVQKIVYVSSLSVLNAALAKKGNVVREDWPLEPRPDDRGAYSKSKLAAEQIVTSAADQEGLPAVILRPGQVVGPGVQLLTSAVAFRVGKSLVVIGKKDRYLPLIHVEDVVDAMIATLERSVFDGSIIHLVDPTKVTQNDIAAMVAKQSDYSMTLRSVPRWVMYLLASGVQLGYAVLRRNAPLSPYRLRSALSEMQFDCQEAKRRLDWQPRVGVAAVFAYSTESALSAANRTS